MLVSSKDPRSILVVDDEPHLVRAVRMYLELQGYTVFGTQSGEDGWLAGGEWGDPNHD
jgi:DNA-binding response OmpR family regulator